MRFYNPAQYMKGKDQVRKGKTVSMPLLPSNATSLVIDTPPVFCCDPGVFPELEPKPEPEVEEDYAI